MHRSRRIDEQRIAKRRWRSVFARGFRTRRNERSHVTQQERPVAESIENFPLLRPRPIAKGNGTRYSWISGLAEGLCPRLKKAILELCPGIKQRIPSENVASAMLISDPGFGGHDQPCVILGPPGLQGSRHQVSGGHDSGDQAVGLPGHRLANCRRPQCGLVVVAVAIGPVGLMGPMFSWVGGCGGRGGRGSCVRGGRLFRRSLFRGA